MSHRELRVFLYQRRDKLREERSAKIERLDARVSEIVKSLQEKGFKSPYLKSFVIARVNPLRFMKTLPPFDDALDDIQKRAEAQDEQTSLLDELRKILSEHR